MGGRIPVSVIVVTRNEERNIARCLAALEGFDEIIIVDSHSTDRTAAIARSFGVPVIPFAWNGRYPKKRQWCLENVKTRHDYIFFLDADEEMTPALREEMAGCDYAHDGYFVKAAYVLGGRVARFGLKNKKLCLFDRRKFSFPAPDDLGARGLGEIEGHYQPVPSMGAVSIGSFSQVLLHHAMEDMEAWKKRHQSYAAWEAVMREKKAHPDDVTLSRRMMKRMFLSLPSLQPMAAFLHSYIALGGVLDGGNGFRLARSRYDYYRSIASASGKGQGLFSCNKGRETATHKD
ncbi:MAG: glycosyltransferase family 2 protein [Micavibrio sp.]